MSDSRHGSRSRRARRSRSAACRCRRREPGARTRCSRPSSPARCARLALTMIPYVAVQILDVAGEAAVRTLAEEHGVPSPHIHYVCRDESVLGGPFFISTAVAGETVPRRVLRLVHARRHRRARRRAARRGDGAAARDRSRDWRRKASSARPATGRSRLRSPGIDERLARPARPVADVRLLPALAGAPRVRPSPTG